MPIRHGGPGGAARDDVAAGVDAEVAAPAAASRAAAPATAQPLTSPDGSSRPAAPRRRSSRRVARSSSTQRVSTSSTSGRAVGERELAAVEAADLAVVAVGAEGRVDVAQPGERRLDVDARAAHVDADRHAHDVTDVRH